ncbi:MAG TPA: alpha/beta hydrolase-fold protein [Calditerricola sp.]
MSNPYLKRTIHRHNVASPHLDHAREILVYLPPGYDERQTYPVVYCQDGREFFNLGRIATIANKLILDEEMTPILIVGVTVDIKRRTAEYALTGDLNPAYTRFFVDTLVPFVEAHYPARREPDARVLAGDSLGASVSLQLALEHPTLFRRVLSLSGAFYPQLQDRIAASGNLSGYDIFLCVGTEETAVETHIGPVDFVALNRRARDLLRQKGASVTYREAAGKHVWGFWQTMLPDALRHFFLTSQGS